jgi:hypothetical protein
MSLPRRISAGAAALIFFAMFFALPLYAAATICVMPCCHHGSAHPTLMADLPGCAPSDCSITVDDATVKAVSRYVAPSLVGIVHVASPVFVIAADAPAFVAASPARSAPPLNLLNSVFRI